MLRRTLAYLWNEYVIGLPMPDVKPERAADPLFVDYLVRCELARRGWKVDHLVPEHDEGTPNHNEPTRIENPSK